MKTRKAVLPEKKGQGVEYLEIEIPTDEAMIEVAKRLHSAGVACNMELEGWQVIYVPPQPILSGPVWNPLVEGEPDGPWQETGRTGARCGFGKGKWFAIFDWGTDASEPVKTRTTDGVLSGRPLIQESLLNWRPPKVGGVGEVRGSEGVDLESELGVGDELHEGARLRVTSDRYERDPTARKLCLEHYGARCAVCGFDAVATYGDAGAGVVHVHHLRPLSSDGEEHVVDPIADLRPVCPNCHMFVHLRVPPVEVDEARRIVDAIKALRGAPAVTASSASP